MFGVFFSFVMGFGATPAEAQTPSKPTVTAQQTSATSIQLDWTVPATNSAGIIAYHVRWRSAALDGPDRMSGTSDDVVAGTWQNASGDDTDCASDAVSPEDCGEELGVVLRYTVVGLTNGTHYEFQVRAENASGVGTWSDAVELTALNIDASLSSLTLSPGVALSPAFDPDTFSYTANVRSSRSDLVITPTATDPGVSVIAVRIGGVESPIRNGLPSTQSIVKTSGTAAQAPTSTVNTFVIVVTADNFFATRTYQIAVSRLAASADANLSALALSSGVALSPAFDSATLSYTAAVGTGWDRLAITPTAMDAGGASIQVGRTSSLEAVGSGSSIIQDIDKTGGTAAQDATANTFLVVVAAEDGTTTKTYQIAVSRLAVAANPSTDASLGGLTVAGGTLMPAFSTGTSSYDISVSADVGTVTFTPTPTDSKAVSTVGRDGSLSASLADGASSSQLLEVGGGAGSTANIFLIIVAAEDGATTSTYTVNVFRASPITKLLIHDSSLGAASRTDETSLPFIAADFGAVAFDPTIQTHSLCVPMSVGEVVITPTFGSGTVSYQRTQPSPATTLAAIASNAASAAVTLADGVNVVLIQFSEDGETAEYRITIARFGLDVDGDGAAAVDGILVARYLLGERGASLLGGQSDAAAATVEAAIKVRADARLLNAGANGILVARYMLGVRGGGLTGGFSGLDASEEAEKISKLLPAL